MVGRSSLGVLWGLGKARSMTEGANVGVRCW